MPLRKEDETGTRMRTTFWPATLLKPDPVHMNKHKTFDLQRASGLPGHRCGWDVLSFPPLVLGPVSKPGGGLPCDSTGQQGDFSPVMVTVVLPPMLPALGDTPVMVNTAVMMSEVWTRVYC